MSDNITQFPGITTAPEPAESALEKAKDWRLENVLIVGCNEDGELIWGGNFSDVERMSWLLECAKIELMRTVYP